ncbi:acyl-CoA dehydrogenase domain-containing protein, partial [Acinetobacter baumannii]
LIYLGEAQGPTDVLWRMENAYQLILAAEPIHQRLQNALKTGALSRELDAAARLQQALTLNLITQAELTQMHVADAARRDALAVDDFAP